MSLSFAKGGGKQRVPDRAPDNLRSEDTVEVILGICEGPVQGLKDGDKSVFVGDTQLQAESGEYNFEAFQVNVFPGDYDPEPVKPALGGFARAGNMGGQVMLEPGVPVIRQTQDGQIDFIEIRLLVQQLWHQGSKGDVYQHAVEFDVAFKPVSASTWTPFYGSNIVIRGKTTSTYVKEYRRAVPRIAEPYEIRIERITPRYTEQNPPPGNKDPKNEEWGDDIVWESFQEVVAEEKVWPNTTVLQIVGKATDQFSSIPDWKSIWRGKLVRVPSNYTFVEPENYGPNTQTHVGLWDGTFVEAWTNNPAWILHDFLTNDTYGVSHYYPVSVQKIDFYEAARWCDEPVPDGHGGWQPRFRFNAYIQEAQNGKEMANYIAGAFNAACFDDLNGSVVLVVDRDEQASAMFAPENVVDGDFEYSYADLNTQYNDITVTFLNPNMGWKEDRRRYRATDHIAKYGPIPLDFIAFGCTDAQEALRRAIYKAITATTETEYVTFKVPRAGQFVAPWDVILIADPDQGYGISGRVRSLSADRKTVFLRDRIYLEAGVSYKVRFQTPTGIFVTTLEGGLSGQPALLMEDGESVLLLEDGVTFLSLETEAGVSELALLTEDGITPLTLEDGASALLLESSLAYAGGGGGTGGSPIGTTGYVTAFQVADPLPLDLPEFALFTLEAKDAIGAPKPYRVLKVDEGEGIDDYTIHAVEINRAKWAAVDNATWPEGQPDYHDEDFRRVVKPPLDLRFTLEKVRQGQFWEPKLVLSWTRSTSRLVREYRVRYAFNGGPWQDGGSTRDSTLELIGLAAGDYAFEVIAVDIAGEKSLPLVGEYKLIEIERTISPVVNLAMVGEPSPMVFESLSPRFTWEEADPDPYFAHFRVEVHDANNVLRRTETVTAPEWTYLYDRNKADGEGLARTFRVTVYAVDQWDNESEGRSVTVTNSRPAAPQVRVTGVLGGVFVEIEKPPERDWGGLKVWASPEPGFTPSDATLVYKGRDTWFRFEADALTYVRAAAYDIFDENDFTLTLEQSVLPEGISGDNIPDGAIQPRHLMADMVIADRALYVGTAANGAGVKIDGPKGQILSRFAGGVEAFTLGKDLDGNLLRFNKPDGSLAMRLSETAFELGEDVIVTRAITDGAVTNVVTGIIEPYAISSSLEVMQGTYDLITVTTSVEGSGKVIIFISPLQHPGTQTIYVPDSTYNPPPPTGGE